MTDLDRRRFLSGAAKTAAASATLGLLPASIARALSIPAARVKGSIEDVQHVVILMQENRSFDHYFGTMSGVRGFGDRVTVPLPGGKTVLQQSDGTQDILPFHLDTFTTTAMRVPDAPHSWPDAQSAWDQGRIHEWPKYKQFQSMGYYQQPDVPFQRALGDAFTICDANHCSVQTGTLTNRVVFMTGTNVTPGLDEPATSQTQALIDNSNNLGALYGKYSWTTYPERLQQARVSWRIYRDADGWGGLLAPWESFTQYDNLAPDDPLYVNAMTPWTLTDLQNQVLDGTLPQVSWVVPPRNWSEHPGTSSPLQGASWTQQVLDALTSNPDVWAKTVFIVTFDENDGMFDHAPAPAVPSYNADGSLAGKTTLSSVKGDYFINTVNGVSAARPYGMGPRVPMYIVSPWSKGGWVNSQVFDHTSTIRFLEKRFGVQEPNIRPWHRAVAGDLTSCFDFANPDTGEFPVLPDMSAATGDTLVITGLPPVSVPADQQLPHQDTGVRYSRALPYELQAHARHDLRTGDLELTFRNTGAAAAVYHVYDKLHLDRYPRRYTVESARSLVDTWSTTADSGSYDLWVMGPNGFLRHCTGTVVEGRNQPIPEVQVEYDRFGDGIWLHAWNTGARACVLTIIANAYRTDGPWKLPVAPLQPLAMKRFTLKQSSNWYDFTITSDALPGWSRRVAGRIETGRDGVTDPAMGLV